jgi:hypothetical protein
MKLRVMFGSAGAMALMLLAFFVWQQSQEWTATMSRPAVAIWAARSAAIGFASAAQVVLLTFVVGAIYQRDLFGNVLRLCAGLLCSIALVSAVALALAGR